MQERYNEAAPLPSHKKPITVTQMGVIMALAVIACVGGVALLLFSGGEEGGETAVSPAQPAIVPAVNAEAIALGQTVFETNCVACHSVGGGVRLGPDLAGVTARRDADWLSRWIAEPDAMLAEGDPIATELLAEFNNIAMPNLQLSPDEVASVLAYLEQPTALATLAEAAPSTAGKSLPATDTVAPAVADAVSIVRNPTDLPAPITARTPQHRVVEMTAVEVEGQLADGTTFHYMTFDGQVPGPMLRLRVGDTMELHLHNQMESLLPHSIDLHAVTGPGGGAVFTQTAVGETSIFEFKALQPGLYVYHCATASIPHHISSGMYGLILVEPEEGLPPVDHEFYVMQGEIYTEQPFGTEGHLTFSHEKALDEDPEYYVFNGAANALTLDEYAMRAEVGDTVRIFFGVGGPNKSSSMHLIGEIFDRVYDQASLTAPPLTDVQTTLVPPGGATMVEFTLDVPGRYILVDHAISRLERGLVGFLYAEGDENPEIFSGSGEPDASGH
ncbi:MAG: copper-containing nitrite reductase [Candidatus Promineifilaceae bacterium]